MDQKQILHQIKTTDTADIDPNAVAEIYALAISSIESSITEVDLQRLILLGAAMYRNSVKEARVSLQFPGSLTHDDADIDDDPKGGFLH